MFGEFFNFVSIVFVHVNNNRLHRVLVPKDGCDVLAFELRVTLDADALDFEAGVLEGLELNHFVLHM